MIGALKTTLWEHQREAARFAYVRRGAMLAMDMGTGKSLTAIALMHGWQCQRVLITCPLSVVGVWPRELAQHSALPWEVARCDRGSVKDKAREAERLLGLAEAKGSPCAVIVNHEAVWREPLRSLAMTGDFDLLVVDESHRAKAPGGKFSRFLAQAAKRIPRRLALTGTPLPHSPLDAYAQLRFLNPAIFGTSFTRFKKRYAELGGFEGRQVIGFKNMREFETRFRRIAIRKTKEEALDLPAETDEERRTRLEPRAARLYAQLERVFYAEVEAGEVTATNALTKLLRLQQVTSGTLPLDEGGTEEVSDAKMHLLADVLSDLPQREPVVCFGRFHQDLDRIRAVSEAQGRRFGELSGRQKDVDPNGRMPGDVDVLACQIQAGGVGVDLSRAALAVFVATGFSLGDYLQARARVHRPGQTRKVTYIHLLCERTIDEIVLRALRRREEVIEAVLSARSGAQGGKAR